MIYINILLVVLPLLIGLLVFRWLNRKRPIPENNRSRLCKAFGFIYLIIQTAITALNIQEVIRATGIKDVPDWGMAAFTSWGAAIFITPIIAIILALLFSAFRKENHGA